MLYLEKVPFCLNMLFCIILNNLAFRVKKPIKLIVESVKLVESCLHLMVHRQLVLMDASLWSWNVIACSNAMQLPSEIMISIISCDLESMQPHHDQLFRSIVLIDYFDRSSSSMLSQVDATSLQLIILIDHLNQFFWLVGSFNHLDRSSRLDVLMQTSLWSNFLDHLRAWVSSWSDC